jgi:hypothetical protein
VLIGQRQALGMAVKSNRTENPFPELLVRLKVTAYQGVLAARFKALQWSDWAGGSIATGCTRFFFSNASCGVFIRPSCQLALEGFPSISLGTS